METESHLQLSMLDSNLYSPIKAYLYNPKQRSKVAGTGEITPWLVLSQRRTFQLIGRLRTFKVN